MKNWREWKIEKIFKKDFPEQLKTIENCPESLYFRGKWDEKMFKKTLAIVGSRRMSHYGAEVVEKLVPEVVANNISIISGFMYGIDSQAHRRCLENGGRTIAVLGGGLNVLYPPENGELYSQILERQGLIISEYENDFGPTLWSFPQRNRIVSGLTNKGVVVIEGGLKSGSLITARIAREQGKKVWAVPGQINSSVAAGTNWLIKKNLAKMCTEVSDILQKENKICQEKLFEGSDSLENKIIKWLKIEPLGVDEIVKKINLPAAEVGTKISLMSLEGKIVQEGDKVYLS